MDRSPRALDLFAGGGGFTLGARAAGVEVAAAVENAPGPVDTYRAAFPDVRLITEPIQSVDWDRLADELGDVDIVVGGPPCEPFTPASAGRRPDPRSRLYNDPVGGLVLHYIKALRAIRPDAFVMENVVQVAEGPLEWELRDLVRRAGYAAHFNIVRAEGVGTPSRRARLFLSNVHIEPPPRDPPTVREAIGDLEDVEPGPDAPVPNHRCESVPSSKIGELDDLAPGHSLRRWRGATGKVYGTWTRLDYDEVAPTIKGSGRFIHPVLDRALTVREHARLMGFPDDHVFEGPMSSQYDQVGEAVPPPLASAVLDEVLSGLG